MASLFTDGCWCAWSSRLWRGGPWPLPNAAEEYFPWRPTIIGKFGPTIFWLSRIVWSDTAKWLSELVKYDFILYAFRAHRLLISNSFSDSFLKTLFAKTATNSAWPVTQSTLYYYSIRSHLDSFRKLFLWDSFSKTLSAKLFPQTAWNRIQEWWGSILAALASRWWWWHWCCWSCPPYLLWKLVKIW